jgi:DtxR family Mn-dependent transcriptional regulator
MAHHQPTDTIENYLMAMYSLEEEGTPPSATRLAQRLRVSLPSVTGMFRRLARDGLITYIRRRQPELTDDGRKLARDMVRRHRLSERFLMEVLSLEWHRVHGATDKFQHALTPDLEQRISALLGHPETCPHGNPIPGNSQGFPPDIRRLAQVEAGSMVVLNHVTDEVEDDQPAMDFLYAHGFLPGAVLNILEVAPFNGTLTVQRGESPPVAIGLPLATKLWARLAPVP